MPGAQQAALGLPRTAGFLAAPGVRHPRARMGLATGPVRAARASLRVLLEGRGRFEAQ